VILKKFLQLISKNSFFEVEITNLLKIHIYDKVHAMELTKSNFTSVDKEERKNLDFKAGDTIRVWSKIQEKGKTRLQAFEGLVLSRKHGKEAGATFTVRKIASGVGVERIFPLYSPNIGKVEILKKAKTRRNKLIILEQKLLKK